MYWNNNQKRLIDRKRKKRWEKKQFDVLIKVYELIR